MTGIAKPDEEVGVTFCFEGGVAAQTNLAHTKENIEKTLHDYFQHAEQQEAALKNPYIGSIIFFDLSHDSEETEGTFVLCPSKLLFARLGKRHVVKRVQPVAGMLKK